MAEPCLSLICRTLQCWFVNYKRSLLRNSPKGTKEERGLKLFIDPNLNNTRVALCCRSQFQWMEFRVENRAASPRHILLAQWLIIVQMQFVLAGDSAHMRLDHSVASAAKHTQQRRCVSEWKSRVKWLRLAHVLCAPLFLLVFEPI